ncbi:hypothetical protein [Anabaena sp. 4-3]|uniref:hypothetical protein n=1 Tax=Anabaena sp. 4-3 TaxID=1811979 RepID=UPI000B2E4586|nr:hypothetical protein [Anabaena sp. 4-3]
MPIRIFGIYQTIEEMTSAWDEAAQHPIVRSDFSSIPYSLWPIPTQKGVVLDKIVFKIATSTLHDYSYRH